MVAKVEDGFVQSQDVHTGGGMCCSLDQEVVGDPSQPISHNRLVKLANYVQ